MFTVFENDEYHIYASDDVADAPAPALVASGRSAAVLPPSDRQADDVARLLDNPILGLPEGLADYPTEDYKAKLQLDAISQPTVGVGVDRFGAYAGGGISFMFSDVLGDHLVGANIQATSRLDETGGSLFYLNRKSRWNWGFVGEQLPYVTGGFAQGRVDRRRPGGHRRTDAA